MRLTKPSATDALPRDISILSTDGPDRWLVLKGDHVKRGNEKAAA